ncbi:MULTISPECIES: NAD-dependent DNA ligase [unclassified Vibrio]|uniref:NAD-dependent DNA ligase n=1 Tax=unclassified Vibrio TaxID=2614977 RepID=UPI000B8E6906|nr:MULTISPECIES: NAD-dependent DNA ligase [unclassified Vibrio]OXX67579.1 NAD-dependent DNA ligase [Vibrio sp. V19_P1S1T109]MDQ2192192.1 NAD-dependent DNA ligase [Vibrio sp. A14(2019)]MDQ2196342.1 NAD-dependent DNA ligase [Vibrio sp. 2017_1457_11]NNN75612.1 NAD-dependent DNA ligase [Vibrio sp. B7]NNN92402.1 NAD-dependent DNA ligase [Vibrio sp. B8-1]
MTDSHLLDEHGQPRFFGFNNKRNKEKALKALQGILSGVSADRVLNSTEVLFLDTWLRTDSPIKNDGDFLDLRDLIEDILEDGVIEPDELEDLHNLINDVLTYGFKDGLQTDGMINQLLGFLQGLTADDTLNDKEILALKRLIESNDDVISSWPGDVIHERLIQVLEDGIIDDQEKQELLVMFKSICGQQFTDSGCAECFATDYFSDDIELESVNGLRVCFTGKFFSGNRKHIESQAKTNGVLVCSGVNRDLDILVIGSMASRDWIHTSHGRKIESVINNRRTGFKTHIVTEKAWLSLIC